ncbi:MAG: hypothetical protein WKG07_39740 [Hymenobacter sp.]
MPEAKSESQPATVTANRLGPGRLLAALGLGLGLFALGQFDETVFAALTRGWQAVLGSLGSAAQPLVQPSGLSTHGVVVGLTYRLLYVLVSIVLLHVLLRGRHTRALVLGYAVAFVLSLALLLFGQRDRIGRRYGAGPPAARYAQLTPGPAAVLRAGCCCAGPNAKVV